MVELTEQDLLTGLLHAAAFGGRVDGALQRAVAGGEPVAMIVAELPVEADDGVMVDAARRVRDVIRSADFVARTGVAEIAVCCPGATEPVVRAVVRRIVETLHQPFEIAGELTCLAIGVGAFLREEPQPDDSSGFLLVAARTTIDQAA